MTGEHSSSGSDVETRVKALERLLVEKELVDPAALNALIDTYRDKVGPRNGARLVAKAWTDPDFRERLLADGTEAAAELGFTGIQGSHLVVVENSSEVHNLIVCTLCSCYPWTVLGLPPAWYKSLAYRSRAVKEPRAVLREFGLALPDGMRLQVWDSNAEIRYLVVPRQPAGWEKFSQDELARHITRDAMVGVAEVLLPAAGER